MLIVSKYGEVKLTRGDTAWLAVELEDDEGKVYEPRTDDTLTLTVKKDYNDPVPLIDKKVIGSKVFHIKPEDTKGLAFGKYKYDVQVTTADGENFTPIADKVFEITKEVG